MPNLTLRSRASREKELRLLQLRTEADKREAVRWKPQEGPQTLAYHSEADIVLYGGAAGGGKTDLILGVAHREHDRTIIFRREFPNLQGIIDRSKEIYEVTGAKYRGAPYPIWKFPDGRVVEMGAMQHEEHKQKYKGRPHDLICFDEVVDFSESQVRFVCTWLRSAKVGQRCRVIMTSNPPTTPEGRWIVPFFAPWLDKKHPNPARPGELRWFISDEEGKDREVPGPEPVTLSNDKVMIPMSRTFIPAKLADNAFLRDTNYYASLMALPEPLRSQMLEGDFLADIEDSAWQIIPTAWVEAAMARWTPYAPQMVRSAIGVDVARGGRDNTVFFERYGNWLGQAILYPGKMTPDGQSVVQLLLSLPAGDTACNIDVCGVGTSPVDIGRLYGLTVNAMNGAAKSEKMDRANRLGFFNARAEWYWNLREALDPSSLDMIALPPDPGLLADLTAPHWKLTARGVQVEGKEDIIDRIGRSPDKGDACVYAFAQTGGGLAFGSI